MPDTILNTLQMLTPLIFLTATKVISIQTPSFRWED